MVATDDLLAPLLAAGTPSAVLLVTRDGELTICQVAGDAVAWADAELPVSQRVPATFETRYDLASVSKLFTAVVVMCLVEDGLIELDAPLRHVLPNAAAGRATMRQLLSHTAGLPADAEPWLHSGHEREYVMSIEPEVEPGRGHEYSCVGFIIAALAAEWVSRRSLPDLVRDLIAEPLGLTATGYRPSDPATCAATEFDRRLGRGMVRGVVHDESSWALGGATGNAGLFATAGDLMVFAETIRRGGQAPNGNRLLAAESVAEMLRPQLPDGVHADFGQGLGFRLGDEGNMGTSSVRSVGHAGFTGTALCVDLDDQRSTVLLTNSIHPRRDRIDHKALRHRLMIAMRGAT